MNLFELKDFINSTQKEIVRLGEFQVGRPIGSVIGIDWGQAPTKNVLLNELFLWHSNFTKKSLTWRLNNIDELLCGVAPPCIVTEKSQNFVQDGCHRVAILICLGYVSFPCVVYEL